MFNHSDTQFCRPFVKQASFVILALVAFVGLGLMGQLKADDIQVLSTSGTNNVAVADQYAYCLLYTSPSPRDLSTSRMPSSA